MSFLSQTTKIESPFESFYGTNIAGSQIATSELNEEEVSSFIVMFVDLTNSYTVNPDACIECVPLHQGRT
jgi:hypothetical protein